ncbi:MAG: magnesium transporter [Bdellovibrionota bacterium]
MTSKNGRSPSRPARGESAGTHQTARVLAVRPDASVGGVIAALRREMRESTQAVYVVEEDGRFLGRVLLGRLLASPDAEKISEILEDVPFRAHPDEDQEKIANRAVRHGLAEVPVVDSAGKFVGVITAKSLLGILYHEHTEDIHLLAGIRREAIQAREAIEAPPARRMRHRLPWLLVGLAGSAIATLVVSHFELLIKECVSLAFFVPGLVYLADAIGTQTEAITIRGLSVSRLSFRQLFVHEAGSGFLIGGVLALAAFPLIGFSLSNFDIAAAVSLSLFAASAIASSIGLLFPWILSRLGQDPALGSGPLATVIQDVLSLVVYFTITSLWLG